MTSTFRLSIALLICFFSFFTVASDQVIHIPQLQHTATIDGVLDEEVWKKARVIDVDNITWPQENQPAHIKTTALLYDNKETIFVAFIAEDPNPEEIRAFLRDRDNIGTEDMVGIKLDTFNDQRLAYQFFINPLGVQLDSIENELTGNENIAWDAIWESAGQLTETGFVVEVAIPLRALNFDDSKPVQHWAVEFLRFYPRSERVRFSSTKISHDNNCWICQMNQAQGLKDVKQGANLTLVPAMVVGASQSRDVYANPEDDWHSSNTKDLSLDVKWGITPNLSLNTTFNPDFSQVEADAAQLSINNTFALFFEEKRTFFLDNIDYFSSPWNLIYTRNIGAPDYGAKVTGRADEHSLGIFVTNDVDTTFLIPGNIGSSVAQLGQDSKNAAIRYRYDHSKDLSLGYISTWRKSDDYSNAVNGFDFRYKFTDNDILTGQWIYTDTEYPDWLANDFCDGDDCSDAEQTTCEFGNCDYNEQVLRASNPADDKLTDTAFRINFNHNERDWYAFGNYQQMGRDFRADLGFLNRTDFNKLVLGGGRIWRNDEKANDWWNRFEVGYDWDITHNDNDEILEREHQIYGLFEGAYQSLIRIDFIQRDRVGPRIDASSLAIDGNTLSFRENVVSTFMRTRPAAEFEITLRIDSGDTVDFANNRAADNLRFRPRITWNPNRHLQIRLRHTMQRLKADGAKVFTANLTDFRATWQFSVKSFVRLAAIYSDIKRNQDNYLYDDVDRRSNYIATQLLYSYKLNPQTLFFAGYSDGFVSDDDIASLTQEERSIFVKFSYAWQF